MTRTRRLLLCACAVLACATAGAGAARAGLDVGVTEDAGKSGSGAPFFATLADIGLKVNRVSINWDPRNPTTIVGQGPWKTTLGRCWLTTYRSCSGPIG